MSPTLPAPAVSLEWLTTVPPLESLGAAVPAELSLLEPTDPELSVAGAGVTGAGGVGVGVVGVGVAAVVSTGGVLDPLTVARLRGTVLPASAFLAPGFRSPDLRAVDGLFTLVLPVLAVFDCPAPCDNWPRECSVTPG